MDLEQWNEYHQNQTEKDVSKLLQLLDEVLKMAVLYYGMQALNKGSDLFTFALYPALNKKINSLFERFQNTFSRKMNFYVDKHYNISHNKFKDVFGEALKSGKAATYTPASVKKHLPMEGIRSARVWNLSKQYRTEIEMALDIAISEGTPANELASTLKKYLRNPDSLFRRYRDKNGVLQLSKKAKEYHSGQGVYRSAYKNAERLARTEINIAYRKADIERWQSMDMIAGYEIKRSRHPYSCEICDMMKGVYPKSFVWVGNHPNCRCYMTPIFKADLKGKELALNPKLTNWIASNEEKITTASSVPMFLWGVDVEKTTINNDVSLLMKKALNSEAEVSAIISKLTKELGGYATPINFKSRESILRKVTDELNGNIEGIKDSIRATIIVPKEKMKNILQYIEKNSIFARVKNQTPEQFLGYSGILTNIRTQQNIFAEIQFNTEKMIYAKETPSNAIRIMGQKRYNEIRKETGIEGGLGHKYYEEIRVLKAKTNNTPDILERIAELEKQSFNYYSKFR